MLSGEYQRVENPENIMGTPPNTDCTTGMTKYAEKWVYPALNYPIYCKKEDVKKKMTEERFCLFFCEKGECAADTAPGWVVGQIKFRHLTEIGQATGRSDEEFPIELPGVWVSDGEKNTKIRGRLSEISNPRL